MRVFKVDPRSLDYGSHGNCSGCSGSVVLVDP